MYSIISFADVAPLKPFVLSNKPWVSGDYNWVTDRNKFAPNLLPSLEEAMKVYQSHYTREFPGGPTTVAEYIRFIGPYIDTEDSNYTYLDKLNAGKFNVYMKVRH